MAAFLKTAKVTVTGRVQKSLAEVVVGEQVPAQLSLLFLQVCYIPSDQDPDSTPTPNVC